ncbi:hemicentin-1-like [Vanessa cardui]|uniref:hemicentin-1-like n=1 Tax=Vanessa cardui TaxID=171605 RepID=UPI001F1422AC|nr:hemicentin-1-like [Vanessa cardui]
MHIKIFLLLFLGAQDVLGKKSFTLVMDTTKSMEDEIYFLKVNIASIINSIKSQQFFNYILIPFGDEDVEPPLISPSPNELVDIIQFLEASGGQGCPENSLGAIETALEVSLPQSYIYVFTDAEAKTHSQFENIKQLCRTRRSQVNIFKSDECERNNSNETERDNIYYEITRNCGGTVFRLNLGNLRDVFKYIKEITKVDWSDVSTHEKFNNNKQYTLTIDTYTRELIVAVSGKYPTLQITNNFGDSPHVEKIIATNSMLVIRIQVAQLGDFTTNVGCQGTGIVTFYRKSEVQFQYGFSPLQPNSLQETASRPIPGLMNYILISLPVDMSSELISVNIQTADNKLSYDDKKIAHYTIDESRGLYLVQAYFEPQTPFKITITCRDKTNYQEITGSTALLHPQQTLTLPRKFKPRAEMLQPESALIDFGTSYKTACKVFGFPTPVIWWENELEEKIPSQSALLEMPSTYISYVSIANATRNGTLTCKCRNEEGNNEASVDVYVNRTFVFDVIQYPTDINVEYGSEGRLYCEVNAYPEAEIKWYHNDTLIEDSEYITILHDEHMLLINNMTLNTAGEYRCEIDNNIESKTFSAEVYVTGLEAPKIEVRDLEIVLKPGDWTEQQCTILKGIPAPEVTWKYKLNSGDFDTLPEGVLVDGKSLKIASAEKEHVGFYVCEASNVLGVDKQELSVKVQYPPKIKNGDEVKVVREGDFVELPCDVDAVPEATVHWDMYHDDVMVALDEHQRTDEEYTLKFSARSNDSGIYYCTAENNMGRSVRTVSLNVLVATYIEPLPWKILTVRAGTTVVLTCDVTFGNPTPTSRWQYVANNSDTVVLLRGHSAGKLNLVLNEVTRRQEGNYQCVAENEIGPDSVQVYLKVL